MRLLTVLALMAVVVVVLCPPALPKDKKRDDNNLFETAPVLPKDDVPVVAVIQGGKRYSGWSMDSGRFFIEKEGKVIMDGWLSRTGAVQIYSTLSDDNYVGSSTPWVTPC